MTDEFNSFQHSYILKATVELFHTARTSESASMRTVVSDFAWDMRFFKIEYDQITHCALDSNVTTICKAV